MTETLPHSGGTRRQLRTTARLTAFVGGPVFWLGTLLHPARDGWSIAAVGERYGLTHDIQAAGLAAAGRLPGQHDCAGQPDHPAARSQVLVRRPGRHAALVRADHLRRVAQPGASGVRAEPGARAGRPRYTGSADRVPGAARLPARATLWLARTLGRHGLRLAGVLLGVGAIAYTIGGLFIFTSGPALRPDPALRGRRRDGVRRRLHPPRAAVNDLHRPPMTSPHSETPSSRPCCHRPGGPIPSRCTPRRTGRPGPCRSPTASSWWSATRRSTKCFGTLASASPAPRSTAASDAVPLCA